MKFFKKDYRTKKVWWEIHGNTSSWVNIIVSVVVAVFTLLLFKEAQRQNSISEENIKIAKISAEASKVAADAAIKSVNISDSVYRLTKESNRLNDSNFIKQLKISEVTARAASVSAENGQKSLEMSKKNFEVLSKPYILVSNVTTLYDSLIPNKNIQIVVIFFNYGNTPALLTSSKKGLIYSDKPVLDTLVYVDSKAGLNNYISANGHFNEISNINVEKDKYSFSLFKQGKAVIYFYGELSYIEIVSKKKYTYKYCLRIFKDGTYNFNKLYNGLIED